MNKEQILKEIALKEILDIKEVAILINRSVANIYELCRNEIIPYTKPKGQGKLYFEKSKILKWLKGE